MNSVLFALFSALLLAHATAKWDFANDNPLPMRMGRGPCGANCKFRFCKLIPGSPLAPIGRTLLLRDPGVASIPFVCRPGPGGTLVNLGRIIKTGEATICPRRGPPVRISQYKQPCLRPRLSKKFFQLREINAHPPIPGKFGMLRLRDKRKQINCLDDLCVKIPITRYQILGGRGGRPRTVRTNDPDDCVSFTTRRALLIFELGWDAGDDLDLRVTEPNGNEIFWGNTDSPATGGKLLIDVNVGLCSNRSFGREQIRWTCRDRPLRGTYKVEVRHWNRCEDARVPKWSLSIIVNGKNVLNEMGTTNADSNALVFTTNFNFNGPLTCENCAC